MLQISKNLLGREFGFLCDKKHLIVDRDTRYPIALLRTLEREGIGVIRLAFRSPNMSAYAERFFRPIKDECLSTLVLIGPRMLRRALREFTEHYRPEWNHEEVGNRTTFQVVAPERPCDSAETRRRFGGVLNYYYHAGT